MSKKSKDRIPLQLSGGVAIVPLRYEVTEQAMDSLRADLLAFVGEHNTHAVVFDLKGLEILDAHDFKAVSDLIKMLSIMGQKVMLCGLSPGIAATITEQDMDTDNWDTVFDLNEALFKLSKKIR